MNNPNSAVPLVSGQNRELWEIVREALEVSQINMEDRLLLLQFIREEMGENC